VQHAEVKEIFSRSGCGRSSFLLAIDSCGARRWFLIGSGSFASRARLYLHSPHSFRARPQRTKFLRRFRGGGGGGSGGGDGKFWGPLKGGGGCSGIPFLGDLPLFFGWHFSNSFLIRRVTTQPKMPQRHALVSRDVSLKTISCCYILASKKKRAERFICTSGGWKKKRGEEGGAGFFLVHRSATTDAATCVGSGRSRPDMYAHFFCSSPFSSTTEKKTKKKKMRRQKN
jgi:hypothetical protein